MEVFPKFTNWDKLLQISIQNIDDHRRIDRGFKKLNILKDCLYHKTAHNSNHIQGRKSNEFKRINLQFQKSLAEYAQVNCVQLRNYIMYEKNGYMGWHTNRDCTGIRYYLTWAEEEGKSFFKYLDGDKIVSVPDVKGWQVNKFLVTGKHGPNDYNYFLHSVESNTNRLSIGYKVK